MSQVKWVLPEKLADGVETDEAVLRKFGYVPVIELSALAEVVEGLRALDRMCAAHKIQDVDAHAVIYKLLAQLEAYRKEGA